MRGIFLRIDNLPAETTKHANSSKLSNFGPDSSLLTINAVEKNGRTKRDADPINIVIILAEEEKKEIKSKCKTVKEKCKNHCHKDKKCKKRCEKKENQCRKCDTIGKKCEKHCKGHEKCKGKCKKKKKKCLKDVNQAFAMINHGHIKGLKLYLHFR